jgi:threonine/homoserine/homoserine lactone efflux protein
VGLAAVVARSAPAYEAIRLAEAGYLVLLGLAPLLAGLAGPAWLAHTAVARLLRPQVVWWSQRILSTFLIGLGVSTAMGL